MKLKFDVSVEEFKIIQMILNKHLPANCKVWVFGSRAKHTATRNSDIDLALEYKEKLSSDVIRKLKEDFNEAHLAFSVDLVDMQTIEDYFREIIEEQKVMFPLRDNVPELRFKKYYIYNKTQLINSDFDKLTKDLKGKK